MLLGRAELPVRGNEPFVRLARSPDGPATGDSRPQASGNAVDQGPLFHEERPRVEVRLLFQKGDLDSADLLAVDPDGGLLHPRGVAEALGRVRFSVEADAGGRDGRVLPAGRQALGDALEDFLEGKVGVGRQAGDAVEARQFLDAFAQVVAGLAELAVDLLQADLGLHPVGDIQGVADGALGLAVGVPQERDRKVGVEDLAGPPPHRNLEIGLVGAAEARLDDVMERRPVLVGEEHPDRLEENLLFGVAMGPLGTAVPTGDAALKVGGHDGVVDLVQDAGLPHELAMGLLEVGDVLGDFDGTDDLAGGIANGGRARQPAALPLGPVVLIPGSQFALGGLARLDGGDDGAAAARVRQTPGLVARLVADSLGRQARGLQIGPVGPGDAVLPVVKGDDQRRLVQQVGLGPAWRHHSPSPRFGHVVRPRRRGCVRRAARPPTASSGVRLRGYRQRGRRPRPVGNCGARCPPCRARRR